jgi:Cu/Ag efflux protein CusF
MKGMTMNRVAQLSLAVLMAATASLASAQHGAHGGPATAGAEAGVANEAPASAALVEGEVRKIDKEAGKITLRHGEIRNLNMAAMTMVLRVQDPAMLDALNVGDKVMFAAERMHGAVTIVQMQKAH